MFINDVTVTGTGPVALKPVYGPEACTGYIWPARGFLPLAELR